MKRLIRASTLLILVLWIAGCRPATVPANPVLLTVTATIRSETLSTPTERSVTRPTLDDPATVDALQTKIADMTAQPVSPTPSSPFVYHAILRDYLHEYMQYGAPIDDELVFGKGTAFSDWIENWLEVFQSDDVPQELRLKDFRVQPITTVGTADGNGKIWIVINGLDLNPAAGYDSLWREYDQALDEQGWMVDQRLGFIFEKREETFELIDILLHSPQVFDKSYAASDFALFSDAEFVYQATSKWLESYLSEDILEDYQIVDYSITDVTMTGVSANRMEFEVVFSVRESTAPPRQGGLPSLRWRRSPYGGSAVLQSNWIKDLTLQAAVWQDQERIFFSALNKED